MSAGEFQPFGIEVLAVDRADESFGWSAIFAGGAGVDQDRAALTRHPERALADAVCAAVAAARVCRRSPDVADEVGEPLLAAR